MPEVKYAEERPKDCRYCYFWSGKKKGCDLGSEENCYYRIRPEETPYSECDGCPYRQEPKCFSQTDVSGIYPQTPKHGMESCLTG